MTVTRSTGTSRKLHTLGLTIWRLFVSDSTGEMLIIMQLFLVSQQKFMLCFSTAVNTCYSALRCMVNKSTVWLTLVIMHSGVWLTSPLYG